MFDDDEPPVIFIDPHEAVLTDTGYALDALGSLDGVKLPRHSIEPDADYRVRLIARLRGETKPHWLDFVDDTKPRANHVRDAVRANS